MSDDEQLIRDLNRLAESLEGEQQATVLDAAERIDILVGSLEDAQDEAYQAQREVNALEGDDQYAQALWEAIVERRTEDAVVLLRKVFDIDFMDVRTYGNLFPERIK
jgi:hypothetical protein